MHIDADGKIVLEIHESKAMTKSAGIVKHIGKIRGSEEDRRAAAILKGMVDTYGKKSTAEPAPDLPDKGKKGTADVT